MPGCGGGAEQKPARIQAGTLTIYSSLPRTGASAEAAAAAAVGQRLALADAGKRVGRYRIRLVELDSSGAASGSDPGDQGWDPAAVEENARRAADDATTIAYLGELDTGASAISVPVTNEKSILQVSPGDGLSGLTLAQPGPGERPERFYPTGLRSFVRLVPADAVQAEALLALARRSGAPRIALVHDGGLFGRELASWLERAAVDRGVTVAGVERADDDPAGADDLLRRLTRADPEAVVYLGTGGGAVGTLTAAAAAFAEQPALLAASPVAGPGALAPADAARPLDAVSPVLPPRLYPKAGRRVLARLGAGRGTPVPPEALYGYESMRVVLRALRSAGEGAGDRVAVLRAIRARGSTRGSVLGPYRFDARGDTSARRLAVYRLWRGRREFLSLVPASRP